eukprot:CAMPEP_0181171186 /NCGR_PEP_ID=MMETSP1096-20121128/1768_1 /TAXON_ID=156174 ORGANISM="Chrysochromulina ericina, Strain CCMP281" /NCGR_SAMPLE_ID=MMETSP1096 /ASSEMBLY_ACC=CAM_ASM_000453 /LENGTH=69 /DNA_ID=CAMNT_0023258803 /DNA_START=308 /DNA_END=517 /DNA_ORIENTATION=+
MQHHPARLECTKHAHPAASWLKFGAVAAACSQCERTKHLARARPTATGAKCHVFVGEILKHVQPSRVHE